MGKWAEMAKTTLACRLCIATLVVSLMHSVAEAAEPEWKPIHITGRVVDSAGRPMKGVMCFWQWPEWAARLESTTELLREAATDAEGRFELTEHEAAAKDPGKRAGGFLWFYQDGHAVHWQSYAELPPIPSHRRQLDVSLKPGQPFSYRIIDPDGHPRVGELIEPIQLVSKRMMIPPPRALRELMSGTTDETGSFLVNDLSAEQGMMVRVISERFGTVQQAPNLTRGMPPVVTLQLRRVGEVEGVITLDRPERLAGRRIHLTTHGEQPRGFTLFGAAEATIDANGRFRASAVPEGELSTSIEPLPDDDFAMSRIQDSVEVNSGSLTTVTLLTVQRIRVTGRVRLADGGVPSGTAEVLLLESGVTPEPEGRMNSNGEFQIGVEPGQYKLRVDLQTLGGLPVVRRTLMVETALKVDKDSRRVECPDLILPKARIVEGRALASDGRPLIGAMIFVQISRESGVQLKTDAEGRFRYIVAENTPAGAYLWMRDDRTLAPLEKTDDPLVVRMAEQ